MADIKIIEGFVDPLYLLVIALVFVVSMLLGPLSCRYLCVRSTPCTRWRVWHRRAP